MFNLILSAVALVVARLMATPADATHKFKIEIHPAAAIFPMLSDDELTEIAKSITLHGLREKIRAIPVVGSDSTDWIVVDGRNRLEALRRMGVSDEQIVNEYMTPINLGSLNASVEQYIIMANIERRNLTAPQRKDLAGKLAIMLEERQKDLPKAEQTDTLQEAADKAGVSRRTAATAKTEQKQAAKGIAKKPTPKKKTSQLPTPAVVLENLKKAKQSASKYGHNWPTQTALEVYNATIELATALAKKDNVADEAKKKLGDTWNNPLFPVSQKKQDAGMTN